MSEIIESFFADQDSDGEDLDLNGEIGIEEYYVEEFVDEDGFPAVDIMVRKVTYVQYTCTQFSY